VDSFEAIGAHFAGTFSERRVGHAFNQLLQLGGGQLAPSVEVIRHAVDEGIFLVRGTQYPHATELQRITDALVQVPVAERQPLMELIIGLRPVQPTDAFDLITSFRNLPAAERAELAELLQPWAGTQILVDMAFQLFLTPQPARAAHAESLRLNRRGGVQRPEELRHTNLENVMTAEQMSWTADAIAKLQAQVGSPRPFKTAIDELKKEIETLERARPELPAAEQQGLYRQRGPDGQTELQHALRVLFDAPRGRDYSSAVRENTPFRIDGDRSIGVGVLCGLVWDFACTFEKAGNTAEQNAQERTLIRHAVINALAQCIEDDGHRVCDVGITQRLTKLLTGRLPGLKAEPPVTPGELLAAFGLSFNRQLELEKRDATADDVAKLREAALAQGNKVYAEQPELNAKFASDFEEFIRLSYAELLEP
jgi:hypothetical protein